MKKNMLISVILLSTLFLKAQGGWTKITADNPIISFTSPGTYKGAAWVDINNDNKIDLFAMPNFIFLNGGNGVFTQLSNPNINPTPLQIPGGCSWGDINNDGYIDFITAQNPSEMYLNNGNNTFQNSTASIPDLSNYAAWGAALADINNDNKLDLLYAQAYGFHGSATPYPCKLFTQNTGPFGFTPVTGYEFTTDLKPYTVPYFDDYDLDGDMDLFIATGPGGTAGPEYCYKNMKIETGNDSFMKMTAEPWAAALQDGQCYNAIDYDNDGDLDICLTNYGGAPARFYKNNGDGTYTALSTPFTTTQPRLANCWGDYDNDGDLDVILAIENTTTAYYRNNGNGTFTKIAASINTGAGSSCIVNCDYDNDGDLDVFVDGTDTARSLWRNDAVAGTRNWVNYHLKGVVSNTSAIGAILKLKATISGNSIWQIRSITAQNSFQGQNDLRAHFGLNDAAVIDSLEIYWPSGIKEYYLNKNVNVFEELIEGNGTPLALVDYPIDEWIKIFPNPASQNVMIDADKAYTAGMQLKIADIAGKIVYTDTLYGKESQVPVKQLENGTYIFILEHDGKYLTKKMIIRN